MTIRAVTCPRFRERLGSEFDLTIALPDECLALHPSATWVERCERLRGGAKKDDRYRRFIRYLFANTEEVASDTQGRVSPGAPARLRRHRPSGSFGRPAHPNRDLGSGAVRVPAAAAG